MRFWAVALMVTAVACGQATAPSPFGSASGGAAGSQPDAAAAGAVDAAAAGFSGVDAVPDLGGPCSQDAQCDDGVDCSFDFCDPVFERCRAEPNAAVCDDGVYCNGEEACDPRLGCVAGEVVACSDGTACSIDRCEESTRSCVHEPRDADGDGDPVAACGDGQDCNDADPRISSLRAEICGNGQDDNCDGSSDEDPCEEPEFDTCADPLIIEVSGRVEVDLRAAQVDYASSCAGSDRNWRDVVLALVVDAGPVDVDLVARSAEGELALAAFELCGDPSSELGCHEGVSPPGGGELTRLLLRGLPSGNHAVVLFARGTEAATVEAEFMPASDPPSNETCGTAVPLSPEQSTRVPVIGVDTDLVSACSASTGELVYEVNLAASQDLHARARSLDGLGRPSLALHQEPCAAAADEIVCRTGEPAELWVRALPAGTVYLAVSATAPTEVELWLELDAPSSAPEDDRCEAAPEIERNVTVAVPLDNHADDVHVSCLQGAVDAVYTLELSERSDIRLVEWLSDGDRGAVSLVAPACESAADVVCCADSTRSPVRSGEAGVAAGSYRVVAETRDGNPVELLALVRPASSTRLVAFADTCEEAVLVPPGGGRFTGNTANAWADYSAGCDSGSVSGAGAAEQMLRLELETRSRVVLDMQGSQFRTVLDVRRGPECPGQELGLACAAGYAAERSFLDLLLDPGVYFIQIDGYSGDVGSWVLDVFVVPP